MHGHVAFGNELMISTVFPAGFLPVTISISANPHLATMA